MASGREALGIAGDEGDNHLEAEGLKVFAVARYRQGEFGEALEYIEKGLELARGLDDHHLTGYLLSMKGVALDQLGQDGRSACSESLALFQLIGNQIRASSVLNNIACREIVAGELRAAADHLTEALDSARRLGDRELVSYVMGNLGLTAYLNEELGVARSMSLESLEIARRNGYQSQFGYALLGVALVSTKIGDPRDATTLHGFVEAFFRELGEQLQVPEADLRDADHLRLRSILGDREFEDAYESGGTLSAEEAIAIARL
jgi:tetratricopeptide (TPR) repeat protein